MSTDEHIKKETYRTGDYIFFEGDSDCNLYIIEKGRVQIFTKDKHGNRLNIVDVEEGESFGEFALLDRSPRSATAQALTECHVIKIAETGYEQLISELPIWASSMLRSFVGRLRMMTDRVRATPQFMDRTQSSIKISKK